jgi:hypothetical protein
MLTYKTVILRVVLYGREMWLLTLRDEHRPRVSNNRVLRRLFGLKGDEAIEGRIKLHNYELHNLYSSVNKIRIIKSRRMRWAGYIARMKAKGDLYRLLVGKPEGQRLLGIPRLR